MTKQEWIKFIHGLPCVVCFLQTGERRYGVHGHHLESVRDDLSDLLQVPLCPEHHDRGSPNSIHALSRKGFYTRYNLDEGALIAGTLQLALPFLADPGKTAILEAIATRDRA